MKSRFNLKAHKAAIFTTLSVVGTIGGAALGVWVGVRTERARQARKGEELTVKDWFKLMWKEYVALSLTVIFSGGCAILSHKISAKDIARLATLATGSGAAFSKYRGKIRELIGEEKEEEIFKEASVMHDMTIYPELPHSDGESFDTFNVKYRLEYDGTTFYSNPEKVSAAIYHLNRQFHLNCSVTLLDFKNYLLLTEICNKDQDLIWVDTFFWNTGLAPWIDIHENYIEEDGETVHILSFDWNPMTEEELEKEDLI